MKDNQSPFEGFESPKENWSKLPHALIDSLHLIDTVSELKVIMYILRHTWGYRDDRKKITSDEFANGRRRSNGTRIDKGTGLSEPSIRTGLKEAERHGFITVEVDDGDKGRIQKFYSLNMKEGVKDLPSNNKAESLRVKDLPPDQKSFTLWPKDSYPRTEKDTLDKNLEKETYIAPEAPPLPEVKPAAKRKREPRPVSLAVRVYFDTSGYCKINQLWRDKITEAVGDSVEALLFWEKVIESWTGLGWFEGNVSGMLEYFSKHELPKKEFNVNGTYKNGATNNGTTISQRPESTREGTSGNAAEIGAALRARARSGGKGT